MENLEKHTDGYSFGSIVELSFTGIDEINTFPDVVDSEITASVGLTGSGSWATIYFTQEKGSFGEKGDEDDGGMMYKHRIVANAPKENLSSLQWKAKHNKKRGVAIVRFPDGSRRIIGSPDEPAQITIDSKSGSTRKSISEKNITIDCEMLSPAPFYNPS